MSKFDNDYEVEVTIKEEIEPPEVFVEIPQVTPHHSSVTSFTRNNWQIIGKGGQPGQLQLIDRDGYSYVVKKVTAHGTYWSCDAQQGNELCLATVIQSGPRFTPGSFDHNHQCDPSMYAKVHSSFRVTLMCDDAQQQQQRPAVARVAAETNDYDLQDNLPESKLITISRADSEELSSLTQAPDSPEPSLIIPLKYEVVEAGTRRGRAQLHDSHGYSYTMIKATTSTVYWSCSVRQKYNRCPASVIQRGSVFRPGTHRHNHKGNPASLMKSNMRVSKACACSQRKWKRSQGPEVDVPEIREMKQEYSTLMNQDHIPAALSTVGRSGKPPKICISKSEALKLKALAKLSTMASQTILPAKADQEHVGEVEASNGCGEGTQAPSRTQVPLRYEIVDGGTRRGRPRLHDSAGYIYAVKKLIPSGAYWACSLRHKTYRCCASVIQKYSEFTPGIHGHNHPGDPSALIKSKVRVKVLQDAMKNNTKSSALIVKETIKQLQLETGQEAPNKANEHQAIRRMRRSLQPPLSYEIVEAGTKRGRSEVHDSQGYSYTLKKSTPTSAYWCCSIRQKTNRCPATLIQKGSAFTPGIHSHNHEGNPNKLLKKKILVQKKQTDVVQTEVIEEILKEDHQAGEEDAPPHIHIELAPCQPKPHIT